MLLALRRTTTTVRHALVQPQQGALSVPFLNTLVRNSGGGGGRPGGKPAFNWREKQILRLNKKAMKKNINHKLTGKIDDLDAFLDLEEGDLLVDLSTMEEFKSADSMPAAVDDNDKKVVKMNQLFGSAKPHGLLPEKKNIYSKRFGHKRIFGFKKMEHM